MSTTRRTLLRGAAWSAPVCALAATAPAMAASLASSEMAAWAETPKPSVTESKTVTYAFSNVGTTATEAPTTWDLAITQDGGTSALAPVQFELVGSEPMATLGAPLAATTAAGATVTRQRLTLQAGVAPGDLARLRVRFPASGDRAGNPEWVVTATPQLAGAGMSRAGFRDKE